MSDIGPDLIAARAEIRALADHVLERLAQGVAASLESERVDIKEEADRRDRFGQILPEVPTNHVAAEHLAGELRCLANTPEVGRSSLGSRTLLGP